MESEANDASKVVVWTTGRIFKQFKKYIQFPFCYVQFVKDIYILRGTVASDKVVAAGTLVGDGTSLLTVGVDNDTVSARLACKRNYKSVFRFALSGGSIRTAIVDLAAGQDGELVVGTADTIEAEAFVVLVLVGVGRAASSVAVLDVVARGLRSSIDGAGRVVGVAASGGVTLLELGRGGAGNGQDGNKGGDGELHFEKVA